MNRKLQFSGLAALVLTIFGLLARALLVEDSQNIAAIHFVAAGLLLALFLAVGGGQVLSSKEVRRRAGFGASVTLYSALFVGVLALVNFFAARHELFRYDSTAEKVYTLAPQTRKVLESLDRDVVMRGFYFAGQLDLYDQDLIKRIVGASEKLSWKLVDPEKEQALAERLGINQSGTIHFSFKDGAADKAVKITREVSEQEIVNALLKLTREGRKTVYYLQGHGEPDLDDDGEQGYLFLKESVEGENIDLRPLALGPDAAVPQDADSLILAAPERPLLDAERAALMQYLRAGGSAVLLHEPRRTDDVAKLAEQLGISVGADVIIEPVVRAFEGPSLGVQPMVTTYGRHPITEDFTEGTLFSLAASVKAAEGAEAGASRTPLALTAPTSWAETNVEQLFSETPEAALDDSDIAGPVPLAVAYDGSRQQAAEQQTDEQAADEPAQPADFGGRVVVIGDADFVTNVFIRQLFNRDFFLNALNWTLGEAEKVSIRAGSLRASTKGITEEEFGTLFLLTSVLFPEVLLLIGLSIWWSRRL